MNAMKNDEMKKMAQVVKERAIELLQIPEVRKIYNSKPEPAAYTWLMNQALVTLMLTPEERKEAIKNKKK